MDGLTRLKLLDLLILRERVWSMTSRQAAARNAVGRFAPLRGEAAFQLPFGVFDREANGVIGCLGGLVADQLTGHRSELDAEVDRDPSWLGLAAKRQGGRRGGEMHQSPFEAPQVPADARLLLLAEGMVTAMDLGGQ